MTDLFVSEYGTDIRICKKDEDGRERVIAYIGSPEGVESPDDWAETADEVLAEWRYYARLFAQAEKMKEALEDYANPRRWLRAYQPTGELGLRRCVFTGAGHGFELAQEALAELKETNDG